MAKKRSVFDINFELDTQEETGEFPAGNSPVEVKHSVQGNNPKSHEKAPPRRSPMASAISETAEATRDRAQAEAAIRAENDALAHEHVRLKRLGLITDLIQTSEVKTAKLTRDRSASADPELSELKESIQAVGLSNPIRVEKTDAGYELIQGFRRLSAFRELAEETGDPRFTRIPAAMVPRGEPLIGLYRKMVDENLIRKDLSFGEMAQLALSYAKDEGIPIGDAVSKLYASALKQKRTYIRQFARVLDAFEGTLRYPEAIPRALGLEIYKLIEADPQRAGDTARKLRGLPAKNAETELKILREALLSPNKPPKRVLKSVSKTTLRMGHSGDEVRVTALDGRVEVRLNRDFSSVPRERLQRGIEAMLATLDRKDE